VKDITKQFQRAMDNPSEINYRLIEENRKLYHENKKLHAEIALLTEKSKKDLELEES